MVRLIFLPCMVISHFNSGNSHMDGSFFHIFPIYLSYSSMIFIKSQERRAHTRVALHFDIGYIYINIQKNILISTRYTYGGSLSPSWQTMDTVKKSKCDSVTKKKISNLVDTKQKWQGEQIFCIYNWWSSYKFTYLPIKTYYYFQDVQEMYVRAIDGNKCNINHSFHHMFLFYVY